MTSEDIDAFLQREPGRSPAPAPDLPRISIVTPSYNQACFLGRTIRSVLNQDYPNTELIIIDGGSNDGSLDVIRQYEDWISYWVSEPDRGQTHAINKGIEHATGDLIGYQNSDDIYVTGAFQALARAYQERGECGLFYGNSCLIDEQDNLLDEIRLIRARFFHQVFLGPQVHNQAAFWTRKTQEAVGLFDESYRFDMDYEFFSRVLERGIPACHIRQRLGGFRLHGDAKTANLQHVSKEELHKVSEKYRATRRLYGLVPRRPATLAAKCFKALMHVFAGEIAYVTRRRHAIH